MSPFQFLRSHGWRVNKAGLWEHPDREGEELENLYALLRTAQWLERKLTMNEIDQARTAEQVKTGTGGDIGWAVREMRYHGGKVCRAGWNGKGMYLVFQKGYPDGIPINQNTAQATGIPQGTVCKFSPYVMLHAADDSFIPWNCSQADLLATDWEIAR